MHFDDILALDPETVIPGYGRRTPPPVSPRSARNRWKHRRSAGRGR